jgi:hypothetical protein
MEQLNGCTEPVMTSTDNLSYGQSKLAQVLWVQHLTKRLEEAAEKEEEEEQQQEIAASSGQHIHNEEEHDETSATATSPSGKQKRRDIFANAFHPGLVDTEIFDKEVGNAPQFLVDAMKFFAIHTGWTSLEGAFTGLYLGVAVDELAANNIRGQYYHPQVLRIENHPLAPNNNNLNSNNNEDGDDDDLPAKLWEFSDSLVEKYL